MALVKFTGEVSPSAFEVDTWQSALIDGAESSSFRLTNDRQAIFFFSSFFTTKFACLDVYVTLTYTHTPTSNHSVYNKMGK